ncbi:MAG: TolC family protein [Chitinophagaceae bacterium]|nr:TolC family protein [Chitinophagaceae bacterium]
MKAVLLLLFSVACLSSNAQKKWTLQECVEYAVANNIGIHQAEIQARIADLTHKQSKLSALPTANISNNDGMRFGKSANPATGVLENQNYFSVSLGFQSSVDIFNFFSKKNSIMADEWSKMSAFANVDKLKNDLALTVANAYLQILLAQEQADIADVQLQQSISQLEIVRKQVNAGALPELNAIEVEAQLANDSANLVSAKGNVSDAKYVLKAYMNLDASLPFDVETPPIDQIPLEPIGELQPDHVYQLALQNLPQQRVNEFQIKAAQSRVKAARGSMYPSISGYGGLNTNYGYFRTPVYNQTLTGYGPSGYVIPDNSGGYINVLRPIFTLGGKNGYVTSDPLGTQFSNNFGQQVGISINIPLFNGGQARTNYQRALLNVRNLEYQKEQDNATLKQDIYRAYNLAVVALEKFTSAQKAVDAAQKSYDFSTKRYNVGMLTTLEQITNQNNLFKAKLQQVLNRYDYVFKMKVLEFYKGQGIKL